MPAEIHEASGPPVRRIPQDVNAQLEKGMALCLSGGGYRAMVFHLGALWRLNEVGLLRNLRRISSVSGGSLTAGVLGMNWSKLAFGPNGISPRFLTWVVEPIRKLADRTVDEGAVLSGVFLPGTIGDKVTAAYDRHVFHGATLQDLPSDVDGPRFVINSTNVQTGSLWRFSKPYMGDWQVALILNPKLPLARAVAASSAFPPVLSPVTLDVDPADFDPASAGPLHKPPFNDEVVLSDGGVYDNLGLETVWKSFSTVLVSDGGRGMAPDPSPKGDWARHALRVLELIDNQVRNLRKRQLIDSYQLPSTDQNYRSGAYWGIGSHFADYKAGSGLTDPLGMSGRDGSYLAAVPTRLKQMPQETQEKLINWGYGICDAALRRHVNPNLPEPAGFPYPQQPL